MAATAPIGGNVAAGGFGMPPPPPLPTSQFGNPSTFTAAANQQAGDYDTIMKNYADIAKSATTNNVSPMTIAPPGAVSPTLNNYRQSADVTGSLSDLSDMATTGGYTPQGIADIRARDISPTRSIYANAQESVNRSRGLAGGYAPGADATQAQMARDESNQIAGIDTAAEAGIAQNVAANRLAGGQAYAGAASAESGRGLQAGEFNANTANTVATGNRDAITGVNTANVTNALGVATGNANRGVGTALGAAQGQTGLYGTTPALTNTFGNQVVQATGQGQGQQVIDNQKQKNLFGAAGL